MSFIPVLMADPLVAAYDAADIRSVAASNRHFALKLYRQLKEEEGNLFLSPYSISSALAMTYGGARGETAKEMAKTLDFNLPQERLHAAFAGIDSSLKVVGVKGGVELSTANALWPHKGYPFRKDFLDLITESYRASGQAVDYSDPETARGIINRWVENETHNKIKDLIPEKAINVLTRLVLTNAIYFKGSWASAFKEEGTQEAPFQVAPNKTLKVPMMFQNAQFGYYEDADVQILEMPYKGSEVSMFVLLPNQRNSRSREPSEPLEKKPTLADLEAMLSPQKLSDWMDKVRPEELDVFLPKFKMTSTFSLEGALKALGMIRAFDKRVADFSGMDGSKELSLSRVLHKAFVEVNEEGTEAAAATAVVIEERCMRRCPSFRADHPFLYLISDKLSGNVLFLGRYVTPPDSLW